MTQKLHNFLFNLTHPIADCSITLFALEKENMLYGVKTVFEGIRNSCDIPIVFKKARESSSCSGKYVFFGDKKLTALFKKLNELNNATNGNKSEAIPRIEIYYSDVKGFIPFFARTHTLAHELFHHKRDENFKDKDKEERLADLAIIDELKKYRPAIIICWYFFIREFVFKESSMAIEEYLRKFDISLKEAFKDMKRFKDETTMQDMHILAKNRKQGTRKMSTLSAASGSKI